MNSETRLCSVKFVRQKCQSSWCLDWIPQQARNQWKLLKWIFPCAGLMAACLSIIYTNPFITAIPKPDVDRALNETLYDTFDAYLHAYEDHSDHPFCGLVWIKIAFFAGFAASHFSMGFLANKFGNMRVLKVNAKAFIMFAVLSTITWNIYVFGMLWFLVAYFSTSSYLLMVSPLLETIDSMTKGDWRWRLAIGVFFQMSWTVGRLFSNFVVVISNTWMAVVSVLVVILCFIYFVFEDNIWPPEESAIFQDSKADAQKPSFVEEMSKNRANWLNLSILSLAWFTLGYNYYGMMLSWELSFGKSMFEHNILASVLALISKICALIICYVSRRKCMPMMVLQVFTAICYFVLASVNFEGFSPPFSIGYILCVHLSTFLITATFGLIWVATPETFAQNHRTTAVGICSGAARIGAITGIIMGELELLHKTPVVNSLAGLITLLSALLLGVLPDMTKSRMPVTIQDIEKVQFPNDQGTQQRQNVPDLEAQMQREN